MSQRSASVALAAGASLLVLLVGFFALQREPASTTRQPTAPAAEPPSAPQAQAPEPRVEPPPPTPSAPRPLASSAESALLDEPTLMASLRQLGGSDPNRTLSLARQGNERFPSSPDAAERAWFVAKSLTDLGRHDEARAEARALVERYRDTRWAEDVYRHLLINPGTHPSERGYGKQLESDP